MKIHELRALTQNAIAERNRTRPNKVYDDLISRMESVAKDGTNYINFHFSDSEEIVDRVYLKLKEEGFTISHGDDPYFVTIKW